jgi:hypothetical protein
LWATVDDADGEDALYVAISEIDPVDGSVEQVLHSRDMAIEGDVHDSWLQGEVAALEGGGLALGGWTFTNRELGLEHHGFVVALDAEGQHDCVAKIMDYSRNYPFQPLGASNGAIYVNGHVRQSGDWYSALLRIR